MVRSSPFWNVARRSLVVGHRCFGSTRLTHLQGSGIPKRNHIRVECIFVVMEHIPFLILFYDALKPNTLPCVYLFSGPIAAQCLECKVLLTLRVFLTALRLNDTLYSGLCFCAKICLRCHVYFALKWQSTIKSNALLQWPPVLTPICCRFLWTHWHSLFPFIIPTATFPHIHLSPPVRFVMDVITTSALDLGCTSDPVLGFAGRK